MNRRFFSAALACALSLSLLASCGGNKAPSGSESSSGSVSASASQDGSASSPESSTPDASQPDGSVSEAQPDASQPVEEPVSVAALSLSQNDFTLKSAGAKWKLKYTCEPAIEGATAEFTSSDESIATVDEKGVVTAVAPGHATITLRYGDLTAECIVRCRWEEQKPAEPSKPVTDPAKPTEPAAKQVDLDAFYQTVASNHELGNFLQKADKDLLDAFYPGLADVSADQRVVYATMMSMNMGEFALIQVKDAKDIDTVKGILQARIDNMIDGGAWYPEPTRVWTECSKIVTNGNYIMMAVHEDCDAIVKEFNALFK